MSETLVCEVTSDVWLVLFSILGYIVFGGLRKMLEKRKLSRGCSLVPGNVGAFETELAKLRVEIRSETAGRDRGGRCRSASQRCAGLSHVIVSKYA
eukprot:CAMPEP_0204276366 /NCGR_PEP_ID=MMETSP0468-20130131/27964_1 /ASSEMBLY_ACC=CAM_ASM_000383 /TAXON_ID=2969 /ORGANISM="Oxyrrhis marina" /LENGTH=95 /DNA_ID=CAMNT_0051252953 /DNA_START=105 /DNA_END=392 /DNA_ORIENTATION=+